MSERLKNFKILVTLKTTNKLPKEDRQSIDGAEPVPTLSYTTSSQKGLPISP